MLNISFSVIPSGNLKETKKQVPEVLDENNSCNYYHTNIRINLTAVKISRKDLIIYTRI